MSEYAQIPVNAPCPREGLLESKAKKSFDFFLDLIEARKFVAEVGVVAIPQAIEYVTSRENIGKRTYAQMENCFNRIADGECPSYPRE